MNKKTLYIIALAVICLAGIGLSGVEIGFTGFDIVTGNLTTDTINHVEIVDYNSFSDIATKINSAGEGGAILIPCGVYSMNAHINLKDNMTIRGMGECTQISMTGNYNFQSLAAVDNIEITDLYINCNNISSTRPMDFHDFENGKLEFRNIHFKDCYDRAIHVKADELIVDNIFCDNCHKGVGVLSSGGEEDIITIINSKFTSRYNKSTSEYGEGIDLNQHAKGTALISNNYLEGFREQAIECNLNRCIITGNFIKVPGDDTRPFQAILVGTSSVEGNLATVSNNIIEGIRYNATGIQIHYNQFATVSNNIITGDEKNTDYGIRLLGNSDKEATVTGNFIKDVATAIYDADCDVGDWYIGNKYENVTTQIDCNSGSDYNVLDDEGELLLQDEITFKDSIHIGTDSGSPTYMLELYETNDFGGDARLRIKTNTDDAQIELDGADDCKVQFAEAGNTVYFLGYDAGNNMLEIYGSDKGSNVLEIEDTTGNITLSGLSGGANNDYVCVTTTGQLYRSAGVCS